MVHSWIYLTLGVIVALTALGAVAINVAINKNTVSYSKEHTEPLTTECRNPPSPSDELILKNRTWISVTRIDSHDILEKCTIINPGLISKLPKLGTALKGADGCKDGTEVCEVSYGVSRSGDSEDYELSVSAEEARSIVKQIGLTIGEYRSFGTLAYDNKFYLLELFTTDGETGVQAEVSFAEPIGSEPILLRKGDSIAYTLKAKTWATYGKPAELDLQALASARDSGLDVRFEPSKLVVPERSEASAKLIITADENARDGRYDIAASAIVNNGGGGFLPACHHSSSCAVVQIGDSDWQIRTYGSDSYGSIGGKKAPEWLRVNVETNKDVYSRDESVEIEAYVINDSEEEIVLDKDLGLIIQVLGSSGSLYGIDAHIFDGESIVLEPESKTLLARPFYWDQETFISLAAPHYVGEGTYTLDMDFAGYQGHFFRDQKKIQILE